MAGSNPARVGSTPTGHAKLVCQAQCKVGGDGHRTGLR